MQHILEQTTGKTLYQVAGANNKGGTSNNAILACVADKYKDTVTLLHKNLSVILRVVSSSVEVEYESLGKLTKDTSLLIANKLPWVSVNFTLHGLLHHSAELIQLNNNWSIGSLSEEALESNNKFVWRFSRKISSRPPKF